MRFSLDRFKAETNSLQSGTPHGRFGVHLSSQLHLVYYAFRRIWTKLVSRRLRDEADLTNPLFVVPAKLENIHVENARLFANRYDMLAGLPKSLVWAEIGTWEGEFSAFIQQNCNPKELHLFDIDFQRTRDKGHIKEAADVAFHQGPSADQLALLPDASFDVIYIDGDHSLRGVARDADVALRKIKPDGLLIFNDYIRFDYVEMFPFGTVPVVNSLCVDHNYEVAGFAFHNKMYCDIMLRKRL